jgi:response regulator NasT
MATEHARIRVMVVDDDSARMAMLEQALTAEGHRIVGRLDTRADLLAAIERWQPEVVLIDVDAPGRDTLESLAQISREQPRPIVVFAARSDAETTRRALQAGVSAYIVDGLNPSRLSALMELAITRFQLYQSLRNELDQVRSRLADQRDIEKAKGLLMKRRELDEAAAYNLLRRMAMDRKQRIGDFARLVITAADVL